MKPRKSREVVSLVLSPSTTEKLTKEQWQAVCEHLARELGGYQAIVAVWHAEVRASPIHPEEPNDL